MKKCKQCTPEEICDKCFLFRADGDVNLQDTINALAKTLNPVNKAKLLGMPLERQQWIAVQAWTEGKISFSGKITSR